MIQLLDSETIDKIAAGEVIERPAAVVRELLENAIDSGAKVITIEIKNGGKSFIRITDDGCGIAVEDVSIAFFRHATSKITTMDDLLRIHSLGFRGEALSSIAAVSMVEMITKQKGEIMGVKYEINGGKEVSFEKVGCPDGTTIICRNLFFNTPAREKFLKSAMTEASHITEIINYEALAHSDIRIKFISDGKTKLQTSGNGNVLDIIYTLYGKEVTDRLIPINTSEQDMKLSGYVSKPELVRKTRSFMNYYINNRYIKSNVISKAIENAYHGYIMSGFAYTFLFLDIDPARIDINVHPTKMEVRFSDNESVFDLFYHGIKDKIKNINVIPEVSLDTGSSKNEIKNDDNIKNNNINSNNKNSNYEVNYPEPFEKNRAKNLGLGIVSENNSNRAFENNSNRAFENNFIASKPDNNDDSKVEKPEVGSNEVKQNKYTQMSLFDNKDILKEDNNIHFNIVGQIFGTYWVVEYNDEVLFIDQHAAHEKVLYERYVDKIKNDKIYSQNLLSPIVITLTQAEKNAMIKYMDYFTQLGFEIEEFGDEDFVIKAVPSDFIKLSSKELFYSVLDELVNNGDKGNVEYIKDRIATISCKAAIKGNTNITLMEAKKLISEMLKAEQPYNCPHGRPTTISMSKYEFDKKFKRIV